MKAGTTNGPRNILVLTYWGYSDALVQTYTLPYVRIMLRHLPTGSKVHLVTLEKQGTDRGVLAVDPGVVLHHYPYKPFGAKGLGMMLGLLLSLYRVVRRDRIDTIHAWCTPAGMIGYLLSLVTGLPLIIDSYEPHAEAMVENGTWSRNGAAFRILFLFERLQTKRAKVVIAAAEGMREYARKVYGYEPIRFHVKPACVDLTKFSKKHLKQSELLGQLGLENKLVAVYAGKFGGIYLDQEVFDLLRVARDHWGPRFHVLLLTGHGQAELEPFMERAGLDPAMFAIRSVPHKDIPDHIGLGDFALTPVRPVPTKRYCTPIKDGEYWALGLPVVITKEISDDSAIIRENDIGCVLDGLDQQSYKVAVQHMDKLLNSTSREAMFDRIRAIAEKYRHFSIAEAVYKDIYGRA